MKNIIDDDDNELVPDFNDTVSNQMYLYFDKVDGTVKTISNEQMDPGEDGMVPMPLVMVEDFLTGKKIPSDFKIVFLNNKQSLIVNKREDISSDGGRLFVIPRDPLTEQTEVIVEKNLKDRCWYFRISKESKQSVIDANGAKYNHDFFIVKANDPNILYRSFSINIYDLAQEERIGFSFESDLEKQSTDVVTVRRGFNFYTLTETNE